MPNAFTKKIAAKTVDKAEVTAETTDEIKGQVDQFVINKAAMKKLEAQQAAIEEAIIGHVRPQQDEVAYCGNFTKSMVVPGKDSQVKYVTMDRFSVPQEAEALEEVKKLVGKKYTDMFETVQAISIKKEILNGSKESDATLNKIATACEKAGLDIATIFDRTEKVVGKDDLDKKQYELKPKELEIFRTLVRQAKPSLR
jgi:hypothetical protein